MTFFLSGNLSHCLAIVPRKNPSSKQEDSTFPCTSPAADQFFLHGNFFISFEQGGYHELHNEPDGVKEKLVEEVVSFIDNHVTQPSSAPEEVTKEAETQQVAGAEPVAESTSPAAVAELGPESAKAKM
jgi:hypothetical protein